MSIRTRALLTCRPSGAFVGLIGARFYPRSVQRSRREDGIRLAPVDLIKLGLAIVGILRQIAALV